MADWFSRLRRPTRRVWVPLKDIAPLVVTALLATEDHRFYEYHGLDWHRMAGAAWSTLQGKRQGGSTLTQQLARIQSARHYGRHWHGVFGLGLVEEGAHRSASAQGQVDAYAGDLITSNPGEVHDGQSLGGASRRWRMLYLDPEVLNSLYADTAASPSDAMALTRPVLQDEQLRLALMQLWGRLERWQVGASRVSADSLACEESLVHTCSLLLGRHATAARWPEVSADLKQVRDWLADDPLLPPTLTQMAQLVGLSKFQLLRRFDQAYGVTPHAWLLQQRAEKARAVIRQGLGLAEAAAACGFADQSHMTRLFVRHFGFTPGAWQKAAGNKPL